jgi:hypothetical protein
MNMLCCLLVLFFKGIIKKGLNLYLFNIMSWVVHDVLEYFVHYGQKYASKCQVPHLH